MGSYNSPANILSRSLCIEFPPFSRIYRLHFHVRGLVVDLVLRLYSSRTLQCVWSEPSFIVPELFDAATSGIIPDVRLKPDLHAAILIASAGPLGRLAATSG